MDFDTVIVGGGICGLSIALEIANDKLLIVEEKKNIFQTSSANALGILGGHGCLSAEKPQSQFRCLLKKSLQLYPSWIAKHFGKEALPIQFINDHLHLNEKNKNTYRLRRLLENEKSHAVLQKRKDFFNAHPQMHELLNWINPSDEFLKSSKSETSSKNQIATFSDTMIIDVHRLILLAQREMEKKKVAIKCGSRIEKIKLQKDKVLLTIKKIEEDGKTSVETVQCRRLVLAAGAKTACLLSLVGYRLKSFFSWAEQLHGIPLHAPKLPPLHAEMETAEKNHLSRWSSGKTSYLFSLPSPASSPDDSKDNPHNPLNDFQNNFSKDFPPSADVKLSLTGFQQKNNWQLALSGEPFKKWLEETAPTISSRFKISSELKKLSELKDLSKRENLSMLENVSILKKLSELENSSKSKDLLDLKKLPELENLLKLENIETYKRYGMRSRTKNWLPLVGFLNEKIFIATAVYKSGITLAPLISRIASLLLKEGKEGKGEKDKPSKEESKIIETLSPLSQHHQGKILRRYTGEDLSWLHYPFSP